MRLWKTKLKFPQVTHSCSFWEAKFLSENVKTSLTSLLRSRTAHAWWVTSSLLCCRTKQSSQSLGFIAPLTAERFAHLLTVSVSPASPCWHSIFFAWHLLLSLLRGKELKALAFWCVQRGNSWILSRYPYITMPSVLMGPYCRKHLIKSLASDRDNSGK